MHWKSLRCQDGFQGLVRDSIEGIGHVNEGHMHFLEGPMDSGIEKKDVDIHAIAVLEGALAFIDICNPQEPVS